jgi:hypothetical protein
MSSKLRREVMRRWHLLPHQGSSCRPRCCVNAGTRSQVSTLAFTGQLRTLFTFGPRRLHGRLFLQRTAGYLRRMSITQTAAINQEDSPGVQTQMHSATAAVQRKTRASMKSTTGTQADKRNRYEAVVTVQFAEVTQQHLAAQAVRYLPHDLEQ